MRRGRYKFARPLKVLVPLIQNDLTAGITAGVEHYRRAGEMLLEAREQVPASQWRAWLTNNFALSKVTAWHYMRLTAKVDVESLSQVAQARADETRLQRELALELIAIGFKALATRLHPDRGGSPGAMRALNRVRKELKAVAETRRFEP